MVSDVYFFDCDKTLYGYDFRKRLPRLAVLTGASQYHLAKTWWVGGHEEAANEGEYRSSDEYFDAWRMVTGTELTLGMWQDARASAMTPIPGAITALRRASTIRDPGPFPRVTFPVESDRSAGHSRPERSLSDEDVGATGASRWSRGRVSCSRGG